MYGPKELNQKDSLKTLNQFIQYFNAWFLFKTFWWKVSRWKIQKPSLASWSFGSQWSIFWTLLISSCVPLRLHRNVQLTWLIIWTLISSCVPLWQHRKKCSINFGSQWSTIWTLISSCVPLWKYRKKCSINLGSRWSTIWTLISSCAPLLLLRKKCSINFFCFKSTFLFPVQFHIRFLLIKSKPKSCHSRSHVLFKTYFACQ